MVKSSFQFQNYNLDMESTSLCNAPKLLRVLFSTKTQSALDLTLALFKEIKIEIFNKEIQEPIDQINILLSKPFIENCSNIIQWLYLVSSKRIKPVCYSLACQPEILNKY